MASHLERVVVLVDMDCFYCQVEEKLDPKLKGKPIAVVQYNAWRGGGIIAVNYIARERGVTRHMRGNEAKQKCPEIELVAVPSIRGKADLTKYRNAGKEVAAVLQDFTPLIERASVDEAYLDITEIVNKKLPNLYCEIDPTELPNTHVVGNNLQDFLYNIYNNDADNEANLKLIIGGVIVEQIRAAVYEKTGYRCSAGIAHNKILAKLSCGLHKPNQQTILPHESVKTLYEELAIKKIKSLGGKFGESLSEELNISTMAELEKFSEKQLQNKYDEKTGTWLYNIARGIDNEPVTTRLCSKSIGCCKRFPGKNCLTKIDEVNHWLYELATEVHERLTEDRNDNHRTAKQMVVSYTLNVDKVNTSYTRSKNLALYDVKRIADDASDIIKKANVTNNDTFKYPITFLGISAGKFEDKKNISDIQTFFQKSKTKLETKLNDENKTNESIMSNSNDTELENILTKENIESKNSEVQNIQKEKEENTSVTENTSFFTRYFKRHFSREDVTENESVDDKKQDQETDSRQSETYETCAECGHRILKTEITTHQDFHMAMQIAKNQRHEMNENNQTKTANETKKNTILKSIQSKNFEKFFSSNSESIETSNEILSEVCSECKKSIPLKDFLEHLDFHAARKLHVEINASPKNMFNSVNEQKKNTISNKKSVKRKNTSSAGVDKKIKTISSFFKPS